MCKGFEYSFPADVYSFAITVYELLHPAHQVPAWADISCARRDTFLICVSRLECTNATQDDFALILPEFVLFIIFVCIFRRRLD